MNHNFFVEVQKVVERHREEYRIPSHILQKQICATATQVLFEGEEEPLLPDLHSELFALLKKDPGRKIEAIAECGHPTQVTTTQALSRGAYIYLDGKTLGMLDTVYLTSSCPRCS